MKIHLVYKYFIKLILKTINKIYKNSFKQQMNSWNTLLNCKELIYFKINIYFIFIRNIIENFDQNIFSNLFKPAND